MGDGSGRLDTDRPELAATVQRLQGMVRHLRVSYEAEAETVTRLRVRVQNAEHAFEAAWNVIRRLEVELADLRRRVDASTGSTTTGAANARTSGPRVARPGRFDEQGFFEPAQERGDRAR